MRSIGEKRKFHLWLVICLLAVCVCTPLSSLADQKTYEGPGWDTPEEAVSLYLEGLKEQDIGKMISAYAVETYVDQFDLRSQIARMGAYTRSMTPNMPNSNHLLQAINTEARKNEIVQSILGQITSICLSGQDFTQPIVFAKENVDGETKAFVEGLQSAFDAVDFGTIKPLGFVPPELISVMYASERNQQNMKAQAAPYGTEEARSVVALFTVDDTLCVLCCDVMRYGDRWFMYRPGGNIGQLIGFSSLTGGMVAISQEDLIAIQKGLDGAELEGFEAILNDLTLFE